MNNGMMMLILGLGLFWLLGNKKPKTDPWAMAPGVAGSLGYTISGDPLYD